MFFSIPVDEDIWYISATILLDSYALGIHQSPSYFSQDLKVLKDTLFLCGSIRIQYADDYFLHSSNLEDSRPSSVLLLTELQKTGLIALRENFQF